jgi:hypothetical protein
LCADSTKIELWIGEDLMPTGPILGHTPTQIPTQS